jgi:Ca2+-binding EF-hand superfamily protein
MRSWFKMTVVAVLALVFSTPAMAQDEKKGERRQRETPEEAFKKIDGDSDGKVTKEEVTKWVESNERMAKRAKEDSEFVNKMFKAMDGDGDNKVTLDEYKKWRETSRGGRGKKKDPSA